MKLVKKEAAAQGDTEPDGVIDFGGAEDPTPLIPEGTYEAIYTRASKKYWAFGDYHVQLFFRILDAGPHEGTELYLAMRISPRGGMKAMSQSSKLIRMITVALGRKPTRRDRLNTAAFHGKAFRVNVRTVTRDAKRQPLNAGNFYSVIDSLLERTAGG